MSKKSKKQLELPYIIYRCRWCKRQLKSKKSIARHAGSKCHDKHQRFMSGLAGLAARESS